MIFSNHVIHYRNVVSKHYMFSPEDMEEAVFDLKDTLVAYGCHPTGEMFYAMLSEPTDEMMTAEIFMPIEEDFANFKQSDRVSFNSYFRIEPMIMARIFDNFEQEAQTQYWNLIRHLRMNHLEQRTPMFVEMKINREGMQYIQMATGIKQDQSIFGGK